MKAVIIAAGCGSRLESKHLGVPKTLIDIGSTRIIDIILSGIADSGIKDVVIVTGFNAAALEDYIKKTARDDLSIELCYNPSWELANGVSVLAAAELIQRDEEFILLMSDHIFQPEMLKLVIDTDIDSSQALLALDFKVTEIPDIDDGMKVKCSRIDGSRQEITGLDKAFSDFQAVDCGMFKLNHSFFSVLGENVRNGRDSLSDTCNTLASEGRMIGVDINDLRWIDLDTPEMLLFTTLIEKIIGDPGDTQL
ncbi:MAG: NTP transferase domain-containing protein [Candidatus Sabulitectum sp.]|nr:NTP transferase domain-containing protein [Candidatus Sabulitectum sp.]